MKTFKRIVNGLLVTIIILLTGIFGFSLLNKDKNQPINIFGYTMFRVVTNSMTPTLNVGDVFIAKFTEDVDVGDIITYRSEQGVMNGQLVTHRVVDSYVENEMQMFVTRGDKVGAINDNPIRQDQVVCKFVKKIYIITLIYTIFTNPAGFLCLIIIPLIIVFISEIVKLAKGLKNSKQEENK